MKHYLTGQVVPDDLIERFKAAQLFNEGYATVQYTSCAMLDIALHSLSEYDDDFDLTKFEHEYLKERGMPQGIVPRHRPLHFSHLFKSGSYAAGYYVYKWAEVLASDAQHSKKAATYSIGRWRIGVGDTFTLRAIPWRHMSFSGGSGVVIPMQRSC